MEPGKPVSIRRCAIYTRKSSEEGLEQDFNSLHAQREACEAFIKSQTGSKRWRVRGGGSKKSHLVEFAPRPRSPGARLCRKATLQR